MVPRVDAAAGAARSASLALASAQHLTPSKPDEAEVSSGSARCGWQSGREEEGEDGEEEEEEEDRRERRSFDGGQETSGVMNFSRRVSRTRTGVRGEQVVAGICSARRPECPRHSQPTTLPPPAPLPHPPPTPPRIQTAGLSADADERQ